MQPNIVLITCHDLGQHLGCYGHSTVDSPALDRLASEGVLFQKNFCTAPQCSPSRAALHTGRHAHSAGMLGLAHRPFGWRLNDDELHMAHMFRAAGYETALLGVQHLTSTRDVASLGYEHYDSVNPVVPAPELAVKVAEFLQTRSADKPFYLEVGFFEPHRPYDWGGAEPDHSGGTEIPAYLEDSPAAREEFAELQGAIKQLDDAIAHIIDALEQGSLEENTWVIFAADHGLAMPRAKCTLYDPGIEAALIMRWPEGIKGGQNVDVMTSHVDVLPTLLEGLGLSIPDNLHGRSLWPLLQGDTYEPRDAIFAEKTYHTAYEPMRAIRTPTHKLIVNLEVDTLVNVPDDIREGRIYPTMINQTTGQRSEVELYDLEHDPLEMANIAAQPEVQELRSQLMVRLLGWMRATDDPLLSGMPASPYYRRTRELLEQAGRFTPPDSAHSQKGR
jgi:N-sulfoglucosamine sulfohydrolase